MSSLAIIVFYGWLAIFMILLYSYWGMSSFSYPPYRADNPASF
jgi:hypothetical protein